MPRDYFVNEGNRIGGQEGQALGVLQNRTLASVAVTKGMVVEVTGDWTIGPATDESVKICGIAANDALIGANVVIETEGFVKLTASGAVISAGDKVVAAGDGKVKKSAGTGDVCGVVLAGCGVDGVAYIKFTL